MDEATSKIIIGIFVCGLALVMWRLTHNFVGWAVFFVPGSVFIFWGCYRIFR